MRLTFEERNTNTYTKYGDVSIETINKYEGILPDELLSIWQTMGYGVYEDGFLQLVNPDEYEFVFDYIDKLLEPSIVFGITALGDLLIWEGNNNKTIASDEGNRVKIINIRRCKSCELDNFRGAIDIFFDNYFIAKKEYFDSKAYLDVKDKLSKLQIRTMLWLRSCISLGR